MSDPGFLKKLLDGAEVEWKPLEKIAQIKHGKDWKNLGEGDVPVYGSGGIMGHVGTYSYDRPTVLIPRKGSITNVFYVETPFWNVDTIFYTEIDGEQVVPRYLYHFVKTIDLMALDTGAGRPSLTQAILNKILVPIPCPDAPEKSLAIQGEIVRILDTFTELTVELTAELAARKKQYNYYRDQLLTFEDGEVEWKALGSVTKIKTGQSVNKTMIAENPGHYPVINSGREPLGFLDDWNTEDDPIGITSRGAGVGSVTWQEGRYYRGNLNYSVTINSDAELDVHYLYHVLQQFQSEIKALCTFDGIPALNAVNLKKLSIPVPEPAEQERIATTLDKFDTLTTSLSEGLPREIALRQQQYEYYRDLFLSFPKPEEAAEA